MGMARKSNKKSAKRKRIGIFLGDVNLYSDMIWLGVVDSARQQDVDTLSFVGRELSLDAEISSTNNIIYQLANQNSLDGLIILTAGLGSRISNAEIANFCHQYDPYLAVISIGEKIENIPSLLIDNQKGLQEMISHLIHDHGYKRIAFMQGLPNNFDAQERFRIYQETLAQENLPFDPELIVQGGFVASAGQAATEELLQRGVAFDALIAANDRTAWKAIEVLDMHGLHVPNDIAVVGFDDIFGSQNFLPPLTTVRQPRYELGKQAFEMLWSVLSNKVVLSERTFPTEIIIRQSCGCASLLVQSSQSQNGNQLIQDDLKKDISLFNTKQEDLRQILGTKLGELFDENRWVQDNALSLFDAFFRELVEDRQNAFLNTLKPILRQSIAQQDDINVWQDILSLIRQIVLANLNSHDLLLEMETLWQQARILLSNMAQQALFQDQLKADLQSRTLIEINEEVITTFDLEKLINSLPSALRQLTITCCFLCLNEGLTALTYLDKPPAWSQLVFAYIEGQSVDLPSGGVHYETAQILPDEFFQQSHRQDLVILPLRFQELYLGYAIFDMAIYNEFVYDALQIQISSAIRGAYLIQQLNQAQTSLENRVEERTVELQKEISERIRVEETLRKNEQLFRALFDQTTDAVFIISLEGVHLAVNQKAADLLGYTTDEMVGMPASQVVAPDEYTNAMEKMALVKQGEILPIYERNLIRKDGSFLPVEINITLVSDEAGTPIHIQSVIRDITKRKRTERVLQALNMAALAMRNILVPEEIFEAVGVELKSLGFECTIFQTNDDLSEIYPRYYSFSSKIISAAEKLLNVDPKKFIIKIKDVEIFQKTIWDHETIFVNKASEPTSQLLPQKIKKFAPQLIRLLQVSLSINAPLVVADQVMGMLSVQSNDLTTEDIPTITAFADQVAAAWQKARLMQELESSLAEQVRAEESLRENEEKFRTLFELSPEAIILIGLNGIILDANQAASELGGIRKEEIIGKSFLDIGIFDEDQSEYYLGIFSQSISGELSEPIEARIRVHDGEERWIEIHPAFLKRGNDLLALQLIIRDITDQKFAELAVQQRVTELEAIYQTSIKLAKASLRVDEIGKIAVQQMNSVLNVDECSFSLLDEKERKLTIIADMWFEGSKSDFLDHEEIIVLDEYPATERVIETMTPAIIQVSDPEADPAELAYMLENNTATLAIIPLVIQNHSIGIVELETWEERNYTANQLNLATTLANQIAVALDNARLFEAAQQELSERLQAETALQNSEEQFRSIFENAVMGLYRTTPDGRIIMANPALIRMLGYSSFEELLDLNLDLNVFSSEQPRNEFRKRINQEGQVIGLESAWKHKDGSTLFVQENAKAIYDDAGTIVYYEGTVEDITHRKRVEKERQALIDFQQIVAELSTRFINLETTEIEPEIKRALQIITEYAGSEAASVWMFDDAQSTASKTFGWPSNKREEKNQGVPIKRFPWIFGRLFNNENVVITGKQDVPPEAADMLLMLEHFEMAAILAVPLVSEGQVLGSISIYTREGEKVWGADLEPLLKIIGDIIINALQRKQAEESIRKLNEELELRVAQRTQQLEAANTELEAFAYSVSHDLRAPLRAINGFSLALLDDYDDQLDQTAKDYLHRSRTASQRMGQLIDDLLKLSRITRSDMLYEPVNLSTLANEIICELHETESHRMVEFKLQPDLIVLGDEHLLRIALVNMLSNAWKFTRKKDQAQIEFGCITGKKQPVFFVRDNGAGFEMNYVDKLFGTFQRLHPNHDFEGTGIGLATVKRIILRHGGNVWAEGQVNQGATFYFTIGELQ